MAKGLQKIRLRSAALQRILLEQAVLLCLLRPQAHSNFLVVMVLMWAELSSTSSSPGQARIHVELCIASIKVNGPDLDAFESALWAQVRARELGKSET